MEYSELPKGLDPELVRLLERIDTAVFHGDERGTRTLVSEIRHFSAKAQDTALQILRELRARGHSDTLRSLRMLEFERDPVPIREWLESDYFAGAIGRDLYPVWLDELEYVCDPNSPVAEWIITGSLSSGKSWAANLLLAYKGIYYCSCLRDPASYFGLASQSKLVFGIYNVLREGARFVDFDQLIAFVDSMPYFREECPRARTTKLLCWPQKNIYVIPGSRELHTLGTNLMHVVLDEVNFMRQGAMTHEQGQAQRLYLEVKNRVVSRFQQRGANPGMCCVLSSRGVHTSWLEQHMAEVRDRPYVHISDYAVWDVKAAKQAGGRTFRVAIGTRSAQTKVLDTVDWRTKEVTASLPAPPGQEILDVPIDYYEVFDLDPDKALRDQAGIPTHGVHPLIQRAESIAECVDWGRRHPFAAEAAVLPLSDPSADLLRLVRWDDLTEVVDGGRRMRAHPMCPRVLHVDTSLTGDCTGLALGHSYDTYRLTDFNFTTGQTVETYRPKVWIDFMLQIQPTKGDQIDMVKIVQFIVNLPNFGVPLVKVTFDGYQSAMAVQVIRKASVVPRDDNIVSGRRLDTQMGPYVGAGLLSVDRDDTAYTLLRDAMSYGAISYYRYRPFIREVSELEHDPLAKMGKGRVDHPPNGGKDVADAVAGVVYSLAMMEVTPAPQEPSQVFTDRVDRRSQDVDEQLLATLLQDAPDPVRGLNPPPPPGRPSVGKRARALSSRSDDLLTMIARYGK